MNEIIRINYEDSDRITVSGRELHGALEIKTAYKDWFPRMVEYGFTKGKDFNPLKIEQVQTEGNRQVKREVTDHQMTIDMAKEICMIQRNEKGKKCREYFIEAEKRYRANAVKSLPSNYKETLVELVKQLEEKERLELKIKEDEPKVIFANAVNASENSITVGGLAKLLNQNGITIGRNRLFEYLREHGYLIKAYGHDRNLPTQRAMDMSLFEIKETAITHSDGHITVNSTPMVTGKGQTYFIDLFLHKINIED